MMLLAVNVITLMQLSYYGLLSVYVQLCIKYEYMLCVLLQLHIYTGGILRAWPIYAMSLHPTGQFKCTNIYMLNIYIFI